MFVNSWAGLGRFWALGHLLGTWALGGEKMAKQSQDYLPKKLGTSSVQYQVPTYSSFYRGHIFGQLEKVVKFLTFEVEFRIKSGKPPTTNL
jgi:hypothetical protein